MNPAVDRPRNLFVASSPLQLFNAIEARERFHAGEHNVLLVVWTRDIDRVQMAPLVDGRWAGVRWFRLKGWRRSFYPWLLNGWLRRLLPLGSLYLGYPYNLRAHLANLAAAQRTVLLDDGHASIEIAAHLADPARRARDDEHLADRLLGRRTGLHYAADLHFFTVYDLPDWPAERVLRNDFRCFRAQVAALPRNDALLFIGSGLVGNVVADAATEARLFGAMRRHYEGRRIIYAVHRYEDIDALRRLPELAGVEVVRYPTLLEYALYAAGELPAGISTFCSSAVDTLPDIYPLPAEVLVVPEHLVLPHKVAVLRGLYQSYAARNIPVIALAGLD